MANESNSRPRRAARHPAKRPPARGRPKQKQKRARRVIYPEFRPDSRRVSLLKPLHFTRLQWLQLLRWAAYVGMCVLCLVIQDSIMSRVSIFGATTDLAVAAMLLITVLEGCDVGSMFILIASTVFYFSGSAPGPYSVGMLTVLGVCATLARQAIWRRSRSSIVLCAGAAALIYEIGLYVVGLFMGLTSWYRFPRFFVTGVLTVAVMFPLYAIIFRIGQIGGYTWKE